MVDPLAPDDGGPVLPPGPRRSTYTPPPAGAQYEPGSLVRDAVPMPTPSPFPVQEEDALDDAVAIDDAVELDDVSASRDADLSAALEEPIEPTRVVWRVETPDSAPADAPASAPSAGDPQGPDGPSGPPAATAAEQLGIPGVPPPPSRVSLSDDDLAAVLDPSAAPPGSTAELIDLFEQQLSLRADEAQRLQQWEQEVRESGVPHVDELVESVRSAFTGIIDVVPPVRDPNDPWARYPGESALPSVSADDHEPLMLPPVVVVPVPADAPLEAFDPEPPAAAPEEASSDPTLAEALASFPPPFGLVPSAVVPPPLDENDEAVSEPTGEPAADPPALVEPVMLDGQPALRATPALEPVSEAVHDSGAALPPTEASLPVRTGPETIMTGPTPAPALRAVPVADSGARSNPPALRVEASALEPTPVALRAGRSIRLFWLWFAVNASIVSVGLGGALVGLGMSLRQAILSALVGVAISFLPLGLGTLAGKWSGQPTMVVSRATFGIVGNLLPAILAVVTRLLWAAVLLGMLGAGVTAGLRASGLAAGADPLALSGVIATVGLVLAAAVAGFGYGMIAIVAAAASILAGLLVVVIIVLTAPALDMSTALAIPDGDWSLVLTGAVLVFSLVGLAWANSSGDLARYQAKGTIGAGAVLFASLGATLPSFALIAWGAALASSDPQLGASLAGDPIGALAGILPEGLGLPLVIAVALSLLAAAALALYSGGFALLATGLRTSRAMSVLIGVVLTGAIAVPLVAAAPSFDVLLRDVLTTVAVPVAAWAGIFGAETMIRTRRVHSPSLLQSGGVYPPVRWVNTVMLIVASAIGWGFTNATLVGLDAQGYLWGLVGANAPLTDSDAGVIVALLLGLLTPIAVGIPAVKRLQAAEYQAVLDS